jgi:hypothetical protein
MVQARRATGCSGVIAKFDTLLGSSGWAATCASKQAANAVRSSARHSMVCMGLCLEVSKRVNDNKVVEEPQQGPLMGP